MAAEDGWEEALNEWEEEVFVRQRDGVHGWLHSYKKVMHFPELHQDLRMFHRQMRSEVLRIIQNELRSLGPLKFKLEVVLKLRKDVNGGVERIDYFTRQKIQLSSVF